MGENIDCFQIPQCQFREKFIRVPSDSRAAGITRICPESLPDWSRAADEPPAGDVERASPRPGGACRRAAYRSVMLSLISSEFPFNSGAYMAAARAGKALNRPGISARRR